jgi:hypothetical protein
LGIPTSTRCGFGALGIASFYLQTWDNLLLSISNHLNNWYFRSLNLATPLVLLKYFLQALSTYLFITIAVPQSVIKAIKNPQQTFLWHGHHPDKKWALVGWDKICRPKSKGVLGLRDPRNINHIMGEILWWR